MTMLYQNNIYMSVPDSAPELSARKLELDNLPDPDPETIAEQYALLADEFEDIGYVTVAGACRRRAAYWRK